MIRHPSSTSIGAGGPSAEAIPRVAPLPPCSHRFGYLFRADCAAVGLGARPGCRGWPRLIWAPARSRSLRVVLLVRLIQKAPAWQAQLWRRLMICYGCDIPRRTVIGPGLRLPHAYGIVLGVNTVLGRDVTIHQNVCVTPAAREWQPGGRLGLARIEDGVTVRAGSVILGNVEVGENSVVGPLAVLTHSLAPGTTFCNAPSITAADLKPIVPEGESHASFWTGVASWLAMCGATGSTPLSFLARRMLVTWCHTSVDSTSTIEDGLVRTPRMVTLNHADLGRGVRLDNRVTVDNADGASNAVIGAGSRLEPGAVVFGPTRVPASRVVPANHLVR
jgi:serine acetyltransferase